MWSKDDRVWLRRFVKEFFGGNVEMPPQGRLNAGEIGHAYLGLFQPGYKDALEGMIEGTVPDTFAKGHHAKWYAEERNK